MSNTPGENENFKPARIPDAIPHFKVDEDGKVIEGPSHFSYQGKEGEVFFEGAKTRERAGELLGKEAPKTLKTFVDVGPIEEVSWNKSELSEEDLEKLPRSSLKLDEFRALVRADKTKFVVVDGDMQTIGTKTGILITKDGYVIRIEQYFSGSKSGEIHQEVFDNPQKID